MAIGAYTMAILVAKPGGRSGSRCRPRCWSRSPSRLLIGLPSLRLRADYFAIATIAAAEVVRIIAQNARGLTGGNQGLYGFDDSAGTRRSPTRSRTGSSELGWTERAGRCSRCSWSSGSSRCLRSSCSPDPAAHAVGPRPARDPRGRGRRPRAGQERASPTSCSRSSIAAALGALAGFFLALNLNFVEPDDVRAAGHVHRLRGPRPRRPRQLLGRRVRRGDHVDAARGDALRRPAAVRTTRSRRCASSSSASS